MNYRAKQEGDVYLRSALIPLSDRRSGRYGLLQLGSGALIATDRLGVQAVNLLLDGLTLDQVHERLSESGRLSARGFEALTSALKFMGAVGGVSTLPRHRRLRAFICRVLGRACSLGIITLPALPPAVTRRLLDWAPRLLAWLHTPTGTVWYLRRVLSKSAEVYAPASTRQRLIFDISEAGYRTLLIRALATLGTPAQTARFIQRTVELRGIEGLRTAVAEGGAVVACLHGEGFPALFSIHANQCARASFLAVANMVSIELDSRSTPPPYAMLANGAMVANTDPMAARTLARRVVAGGVVTVPLDAEMPGATNDHVATLAGWTVQANLGAAWLAMRSGRPLFLATTYWNGKRLVVEYSGPLTAPAGMSKPEQVQALTARLYERADRWIQAHPGKWLGWTQVESFAAQPATEYAMRSDAGDRWSANAGSDTGDRSDLRAENIAG